MEVIMDECRFRCPPDRFLLDRDLRAVEDLLRDMPAFISSLRGLSPPGPDSPRKKARIEEASSNGSGDKAPKTGEPKTAADRVNSGLLMLSPAEWTSVQERFAAVAARRKGSPKVP